MRHAPWSRPAEPGKPRALQPNVVATASEGASRVVCSLRKPPAALERVHSRSSPSGAAPQQHAISCNRHVFVAPARRRGLLQHLRERNCLARLQRSSRHAPLHLARLRGAYPRVLQLKRCSWVGSSQASSMLATWAHGWLFPSATACCRGLLHSLLLQNWKGTEQNRILTGGGSTAYPRPKCHCGGKRVVRHAQGEGTKQGGTPRKQDLQLPVRFCLQCYGHKTAATAPPKKHPHPR